jgi:hypothetical protein
MPFFRLEMGLANPVIRGDGDHKAFHFYQKIATAQFPARAANIVVWPPVNRKTI